MAAILKKITVKDVGLKMADILETHLMPAGEGKPVKLVKVLGIVNRCKIGTTDKGEYVRFIGQFEATNELTGEVFTAGEAILPGALPELLHAAMLQEDGSYKQAQFAVQVSAAYNKTAVAKYVFVTESLVAPKETDAMQALKAQLADAAPSLPAPAEEKPSTDAQKGVQGAKDAGKGKGGRK